MANTTPKPSSSGQDDEATTSLLASLGSLKDGFNTATGAMAPFVAALSPASMGLFNEALRDLSATIGTALQPVFDAATVVVRDFADALLPIMEQLRPIMEELAGIIISTLIPVIDAFASIITSLLPILRPLMDVLKAVSIVFQTVVTIVSAFVSAIIDAIGGALGGADGIKSWSEQLVDTVKMLAKNLILLVGATAKWLGATGFLDRLIKGFDKGAADRKSSKGMGAATDASITDLKGFGNRVAANAFTATKSGTKTQEDWLEDVVAELKLMRKDDSNWEKALYETLKRWWNEIVKTGLDTNASIGRNVLRFFTLDFNSSNNEFDIGFRRWLGDMGL